MGKKKGKGKPQEVKGETSSSNVQGQPRAPEQPPVQQEAPPHVPEHGQPIQRRGRAGEAGPSEQASSQQQPIQQQPLQQVSQQKAWSQKKGQQVKQQTSAASQQMPFPPRQAQEMPQTVPTHQRKPHARQQRGEPHGDVPHIAGQEHLRQPQSGIPKEQSHGGKQHQHQGQSQYYRQQQAPISPPQYQQQQAAQMRPQQQAQISPPQYQQQQAAQMRPQQQAQISPPQYQQQQAAQMRPQQQAQISPPQYQQQQAAQMRPQQQAQISPPQYQQQQAAQMRPQQQAQISPPQYQQQQAAQMRPQQQAQISPPLYQQQQAAQMRPQQQAQMRPQQQPQMSQHHQPQQHQPQRGQQQKGESQKVQPPKGQQASVSPPTKQLSRVQMSEVKPQMLAKVQPGTKCRKRIRIETNHLQLILGNLRTAIHYDVNIVPDTPKKHLRGVVELFRQKHFPNRYPAFDGRKNLYSTTPLPFDGTKSDEIIIRETDGGRDRTYKVEIKFANEVDLSPLHRNDLSMETPREALQVVDIVLRSAPAMTLVPVGRSFFVKPPVIIDLGEGMEMYSGFYQSAIRGWKPFLNVDVAHKAFPKSINVTDALVELFDSRYQPFQRENLTKPLDGRQQPIFEKFIKNLRVIYEIPGNHASRRAYRVNGIDQPPSRKVFKLDSGRDTTIENYFASEKRYRLKYPNLPSLWVGDRNRPNRILLPLELCTIEGNQVVNRKMTENQTSSMIKHAATSTDVRKKKIMNALTQAKHNENKTVREFGFSIAHEFEKLDARVLNPPELSYLQGTVKPSKGVWRGGKFSAGVEIKKWTIACADRRPPRPDELNRLAEMIRRFGSDSGMQITEPAVQPFPTIGSTLNDIKKYFLSQKDKQYDVIFVIVPNSGQQYSYVKTAAEINSGCLTQCLKMRTLGKINPQTVTNILLKVNAKLNGTNHFLHSRPPIMNRPCMIMGADVTHPSPDSQNIPSVAAVTASHDPKAFKYNICWRLQPPRMEIIEDLEAITKEQLMYFFQKTRVKPERIVFFRDGVSEGQFDQVIVAELRAIRSACKKLEDGYEPAITFLVVQKRHHTRLFPTDPRDSEDRNNNVPAGTCVDTTITHPFMQDFYLVSHASIQGVAKPTKYCTLWDDNGMSNDDIEELSYYLCHMFTRCNRSVSYPAPTYYAHLAAARAKVYIENDTLNLDNLRREYEKYTIQDDIRKGKPMFFV